MLQFWIPTGLSFLGANGLAWGLIQWRLNRKKTGADTAAVFTQMAETIASRAEKTAQRDREDAEKLREQNEALHEEVRALREEVKELRPLRAEVEELRQRLALMQQDVSATRTAVERQGIIEDLRWLGSEAPEPGQNND